METDLASATRIWFQPPFVLNIHISFDISYHDVTIKPLQPLFSLSVFQITRQLKVLILTQTLGTTMGITAVHVASGLPIQTRNSWNSRKNSISISTCADLGGSR